MERFSELLESFPQHDLNAHQVVQTFYNGVDVCTCHLLDSQAPITKKNSANGKDILEELTRH